MAHMLKVWCLISTYKKKEAFPKQQENRRLLPSGAQVHTNVTQTSPQHTAEACCLSHTISLPSETICPSFSALLNTNSFNAFVFPVSLWFFEAGSVAQAGLKLAE